MKERVRLSNIPHDRGLRLAHSRVSHYRDARGRALEAVEINLQLCSAASSARLRASRECDTQLCASRGLRGRRKRDGQLLLFCDQMFGSGQADHLSLGACSAEQGSRAHRDKIEVSDNGGEFVNELLDALRLK